MNSRTALASRYAIRSRPVHRYGFLRELGGGGLPSPATRTHADEDGLPSGHSSRWLLSRRPHRSNARKDQLLGQVGEFEVGVSSFASLYERQVLPVEVTTIEIIEAVVPADYTAGASDPVPGSLREFC